MGHFILGAVALKILMTGTLSPFSFLIDCHIFELAIFPADSNGFLIRWQEFVRVLSESNEVEQSVMLRDLCCEFMCMCIIYGLEQCHGALDYGESRVAVREGPLCVGNRQISSFLAKVHICTAKAEWHNGHT